jgi:PAS domain S-box-containing protein
VEGPRDLKRRTAEPDSSTDADTSHVISRLRASDDILSISADAIISTDSHQRIIRFNRGAEEIFGYGPEEILGAHLDVLIPPRFRATHSSHVEVFGSGKVVARRMGERGQISGLRKSGEEFPAEASISKTRAGGELIYTVALRDVTERVRAEQAQRFLAQAGQLLASSLEVDRTLQSVAELAVPMLGDWCTVFLREGDRPLRRMLTVHADPTRATVMQRLREIPFSLPSGHPVSQVLLRAMTDTAEHHELLVSLQPNSVLAVPLTVRERTIGAITFFTAVGQRRPHSREDLELATELAHRAALALDSAQLFAEARSAVRARDDVLAVVSHDLGNPLAAIRLGTTLLLRTFAADDVNLEPRRQVENIRTSAIQMERLIQDLLEIKRIEAGYLTLERTRVHAASLLTDVMETLAPLIENQQLRLINRGAPEHAQVRADRERIAQVFSNLVGNAAKFTPPGGKVELSAEVVGANVVFSVRDNGPGIPAEHLPHVFDRFWQARRTGRHGVGLGLAIVKGIVGAHGGEVSVESELGAGSTFCFSLVLDR